MNRWIFFKPLQKIKEKDNLARKKSVLRSSFKLFNKVVFKPFAMAFCVFALIACHGLRFGGIGFQGSFKGSTSNYQHTKQQCSTLFCSDGISLTSIDTNNTACHIIIANGKDVKTYVSRFANAVVYIWDPLCRSKMCPLIEVVKQKCKSENKKLILVAEYYDCENMTRVISKGQDIIGIDTRYYKSKFIKKYIPKFLFDLTGTQNINLAKGKFLHFEKGYYKGVKETP